jgi:hypothetical protein
LPIGRGGTGATSLTASGYLKGNGTSAITSQSGIPASDITSGELAIARGGTGFTDAILPRRSVAGYADTDINGQATITFPASRFTSTPFVVLTRTGSVGSGSFETPLLTATSSTSFSVFINFSFAGFTYIAMQNS